MTRFNDLYLSRSYLEDLLDHSSPWLLGWKISTRVDHLWRIIWIVRHLGDMIRWSIQLESIIFGGSLGSFITLMNWVDHLWRIIWIVRHLGDMVRWSLLKSIIFRGSLGSFITLVTWLDDIYYCDHLRKIIWIVRHFGDLVRRSLGFVTLVTWLNDIYNCDHLGRITWIVCHFGDLVRWSLLESIIFGRSLGSFVTLVTWLDDLYLSQWSLEDLLECSSPWWLGSFVTL